jgi:hypothetical protein
VARDPCGHAGMVIAPFAEGVAPLLPGTREAPQYGNTTGSRTTLTTKTMMVMGRPFFM